MAREEIKKLINESIKSLQKEGVLSDFEIPQAVVGVPENKDHGDYATNIAMTLAKLAKKSPMEIADLINAKLESPDSKLFSKTESAAPGFINLFLSKKYLQEKVQEILKQKEKYGDLKIGESASRRKKINIEFISANPTGPLTLGNGRGGFGGDVLANVLIKAGYKVEREYYINDGGEQVRKLGHSVLGDDQAVYKGEYIDSLKKQVSGKKPGEIGCKAAEIILKDMIKPTVKKMGIKYDVWFSEKSLYQKGKVEKALTLLKEKGLTYEKEGALWFKSVEFGDDKDRVLVKADGEKTYLASDLAYMQDKFSRGFERLIFIWGADHYGYIGRMKAAAEALGYGKDKIEIIIMQLVKLFEAGKEVRMSKRTGIYVTLDELIGEVGVDVARFFFLTRSSDSHLNFDLNLAKEQSEKNPVYYIQYAHARISSILRKEKPSKKIDYSLLKENSELSLIKQLAKFPEVVEDTARDYQIQRVPQYALDLATVFHQFYHNLRVISEDKNITQARLSLVLATKIVLKNTLDLMGISAPEKM